MWVHEFAVEGVVGFPMDMLRYDSCHPARSEDVFAIDETSDIEVCQRRRKSGTPFRVALSRSGSTKVDAERVTEERWRSFGWSVIPDSRNSRNALTHV